MIARALTHIRALGKRSDTPDTLDADLARPLRKAYLTLSGIAITCIVFAVAIPVASAVVTSGTVSPIGERRIIEHRSGGTLASLNVREGDSVRKGDVLAVIDDAPARAALAVARNRLVQAVAEEVRLHTERSGRQTLDFDGSIPPQLRTRETEPIFTAEVERFRSRLASHRLRAEVLQQRIAQRNEQIDGLRVQEASILRQIEITTEELIGLERLFKRRLVPKPRLLETRRRVADLEGQAGAIAARIAEAGEAIGETRLQIAALDEQRASEIDAEIAETQAERLQWQEEVSARSATVLGGTVTAPITGVVTNVRATAEGGVLAPGDALLDIVPSEENLIIEASIRPQDVNDVSVGQAALVMLTALPQRASPRVMGTVKSLSPDAYLDPATGERTFRVLIEVDDEVASDRGLTALTPGMPAQVYITARERSVLSYLIDPLAIALSRTFRES